ncbi:MAG: DedA family protein [Planctomycetes bacterium]|nr:DedA family protein [Planctomycetota bacterium]
MLLLDLSTKMQEMAQSFSYMGPFVGLLLCGIGLPAPEETFLIAAGFLLHKGHVEFLPITALCSLAILFGDSIPYFLGRRYGMQALEIPWVARALHPERFARFRKRFDAHGNWAIFGCRFLPMLRIPGYFVAGTMGMRYSRLLMLDSLGVLLTVPISVFLGKLLAEQTDRLKESFHDLHLILAFLVLVLALGIAIRVRWARANAAQARNEPPEGPAS